MNKDPFKVFLQKQRDNQEINEIAALGRVAGATGKKVIASNAAKSFRERMASKAAAKAAAKNPTPTLPGMPKDIVNKPGIGSKIGGALKTGMGKVGRGIQSLDTPRNRALAGKAAKGIAAFAKKGGFSSGFNQLHRDSITTGYPQAGGALGGGLNRLVGVGTQAGDEADIARKRGDSSRSPRDPFAGLTPTEKRNAMRYGAASGG